MFWLFYALLWWFVFLQTHKAKNICKKETESIPWALAPTNWIIFVTIRIIQGEAKAKAYAEAWKSTIRGRYCKFAVMGEFLTLTAMVLSLIQFIIFLF